MERSIGRSNPLIARESDVTCQRSTFCEVENNEHIDQS